MSSLRARYHTKYDVALFSLQTVRPVPALMRFSAPVKKHWLGSFSIVLPRSGLRGFVPVVRDRREQGPPAAGGRGQGRGGGGVGAVPGAYMAFGLFLIFRVSSAPQDCKTPHPED